MPHQDILQSIVRWIHIVAGIIWVGHLYFFNWVNGPFAATLDPDTKKKVVPELMPRALFWFRWGAAWTWFSGLLLLVIIFYHGGVLFEDPTQGWSVGAFVLLAVVFFGVYLYELLMKSGLKSNLKAQAAVFLTLLAGILYLMDRWAGFGYRGYTIHIGTLFGTIMAFNVWFRIWPAQQKIITAVKNGEKPDADLVAMAGLRSKQNTYLSVPLVWTMISSHTTWASSCWFYLLGAIVIAWIGVTHLYKKAGKVKGF